MRHTLGPWYVEPLEGLGRFVVTARTKGGGQPADSYLPQTAANALLIAAAPDMLDANRECLAACVECAGNLDYDCTRAPCPQVRAAIAKATAGP